MDKAATKPIEALEEPIKVLHLIDSLDLGGAQTVLFNWLKYRDRSRFAVELATFHATEQSLFMGRARGSGISLHVLSRWRWFPIYLPRLFWLLLRKRYAVVHCHLFASNWIGKPLARLLGVPVIISHDHCNDTLRASSWLARQIDRWANGRANAIITVAASIKDFLVKREKIPDAKIWVIPNGVAGRPGGRPGLGLRRVIGGAGRLARQKNFHRFFAIAHALKALDQRYTFKVAGSGPLEAELKLYAASLHLEVDWLGELKSLDQFFGEIDLFLLTSDFEGLPMSLLECLQQGVPVAATAVDGVKEQFGDTILLLSPEASPATSAERIHQLLFDAEGVARRIVQGQELIRERFSAESQMAQIEELYRRFANRR
ncbi:MAG TPA: glycosyltransferase [Chthoniobacterales bacterium]|nr:glycosyltransferase [Chthoniobacterales bacterium]